MHNLSSTIHLNGIVQGIFEPGSVYVHTVVNSKRLTCFRRPT